MPYQGYDAPTKRLVKFTAIKPVRQVSAILRVNPEWSSTFEPSCGAAVPLAKRNLASFNLLDADKLGWLAVYQPCIAMMVATMVQQSLGSAPQ